MRKSPSEDEELRSDPYFIVWRIEADSAELLRNACDSVNSAIQKGLIVHSVFSGGTSEKQEHALADFFERICLLQSSMREKNTQRLFFQRKTSAGRFWKDAMVFLLNKARLTKDIRVNADYRVDDERVHETAARIPTWFADLSVDAQAFWIAGAKYLLGSPTFSFADLHRAAGMAVTTLKSMHRNSYRAIHRAHSLNPLWSSWDRELQCNFYKMEPVVRDMILSLAVTRENAPRIAAQPAA